MALQTEHLKMESWPVDRLVMYARNPRKNDEQVDRMVSAIREFGFRIPVVARSDGTVVDGHLRLKAAKKLGMEEIPVVLADELSEAQVKAFRLLANRSANWADWDNELLAQEFAELKEMNFDLDLTGFGLEEVDLVVGGNVDPLENMPGLPDGDREPFQQMTFTLHDEQAEQVKAAIEAAKGMGAFDSPNENSNGNALARVCETFLTHYANG